MTGYQNQGHQLLFAQGSCYVHTSQHDAFEPTQERSHHEDEPIPRRSEVKIMAELLSAMSENIQIAGAGVRSGLSMHTDCSIHTGTSDARCVQVFKRYIYALHSRHSFAHFTAIRRQGFSKYNTPQTTLIPSSSFTVFRRQESSKYKPPQTTPSMLRYFSPLSEVEDC